MRLLFSFPLLVGLALLPVEALVAPAVREQSRPAGNLTLRNVAFCAHIGNYGNWTRFSRNVFTPGQRVFLYADIDNFTSEWTTDKAWHVITKSTITIYGKTGDRGRDITGLRSARPVAMAYMKIWPHICISLWPQFPPRVLPLEA